MASYGSVAGALLSAGVFMMMGCLGSPTEAPVEADVDVPLEPQAGPVGANGMLPSDFWDAGNLSALRALGGGALLGAGNALVATSLTGTAGGRSVLDYTVRCALAKGTTVYGPGGTPYGGAFGLAPGWASRGLTTSEQRWMSACLFQHLNGLGANVDIMLEGSHPALQSAPSAAAADFTVRDATVFGNVFVPALVSGYACIDPDLNLSCPLDLSAHTTERLCGLLPTCGITFLGLCNLNCTEDAAGNQTCRPLLGLLGPTYSETIRTSIRDTDVVSLYPGCDLL